MNCSRRIYKGNAYEICLPLVDSGVTLVRIYTRGDIIIEKEPEITADSMCIQLTADELAGLADGVIRYEAITDTDAYVTNSPYILITPDWYSGRTIDDIIQDAYDSGYTDGYEDGGGSGGYDSGYTDGYESGYTQGMEDAIYYCETDVFHFTNISDVDGTITLSLHKTQDDTGEHPLNLRYSHDKIHWTEEVATSDKVFSIPAGESLYFDGRNNPQWSDWEELFYWSFTSVATDTNARYSVGGDISTLVSGSTTYAGIFRSLFDGHQALVYADELVIPYDTVANHAFNNMFRNCSNLMTAPELPATTVGYGAYAFMFGDCGKLVEAPELPATNLSFACYQGMFRNCGLLEVAPELPATVVPQAAYSSMFRYCTSLVNLPELPATELGTECYAYMFQGCSSIVNTPELPATVLAIGCYRWMFRDCDRLRFAPELPATVVPDRAYENMFYNSYNLREITCHATTLGEHSTDNWVFQVRSTGTFYCPESMMEEWSVGADGIPEGWTIQRIMPPYNQQYLTIQALEAGEIEFTNSSSSRTVYLRKNYGEWYPAENWATWYTQVVPGDTLELKGENTSYDGILIRGDCKFNLYGNIMSLVGGDDFANIDGMYYDHMFRSLFQGSKVVDASNLILPSNYISEYAFAYMFNGCEQLVAAPALPATSLGMGAYQYMFKNCVRLVTAPELPCQYPSDYAYEGLFYGCTNLNYIKCMAYYNTQRTLNWVAGVQTNSGTFIYTPNAGWSRGADGIPQGWNAYDYLFESDVKSITAHLEATSVTITIKSVYSWTRTSQPDWARTNKVSGQPGEVTVRIDIESATSPRFGDIVFTDEKGNTIKISVTQAEMPIIWVDDFPDGTSEDWGYAEPYDPEFCQEFYEHESFDAYLDDYLADKQDNGCNKYRFCGEMNFDGEAYWMYEPLSPETGEPYGDDLCIRYGLLPKTSTPEFLSTRTLAYDHSNSYLAFSHYLFSDGTEYEVSVEPPYILVDFE